MVYQTLHAGEDVRSVMHPLQVFTYKRITSP